MFGNYFYFYFIFFWNLLGGRTTELWMSQFVFFSELYPIPSYFWWKFCENSFVVCENAFVVAENLVKIPSSTTRILSSFTNRAPRRPLRGWEIVQTHNVIPGGLDNIHSSFFFDEKKKRSLKKTKYWVIERITLNLPIDENLLEFSNPSLTLSERSVSSTKM